MMKWGLKWDLPAARIFQLKFSTTVCENATEELRNGDLIRIKHILKNNRASETLVNDSLFRTIIEHKRLLSRTLL